jgi:hypothetical protein
LTARYAHTVWLPTLISLLALLFSPFQASGQVENLYKTDLPTPTGSGLYGNQVVVLPNGNIVVTDPTYSTDTENYIGAVYLYDGDTLALISTLTGTETYDNVGSGNPYTGIPGVVALSNGNFVVVSPYWNELRGAVTWVDGDTGLNGTVSVANSLIGVHAGDPADFIGTAGVTALANGNYVVLSPLFTDGETRIGAATWGDGTTGISGVVSESNSLVGTPAFSFTGLKLTFLTNGNYLVHSYNSVTWGSAAAGVIGTVSAANSLVGSKASDHIGVGIADQPGIVLLSNGNYVVLSPVWDNGAVVDAGAVTWGNGATGTSGVVSSANSLVGIRPYDNVGFAGSRPGVVGLANDNYVVISYIWDSPVEMDVGAVTWGNGATGTSGVVSSLNSLVGSNYADYVGFGGVTALSNGNYVVASPWWRNGTVVLTGAVTWADGSTGTSGTVSAANSLVGTSTLDYVGSFGVVALPNGNYLARSPQWGIGGAVTWGDGTAGITGEISSDNSLIGVNSNDRIGQHGPNSPYGVTVLQDGNYVVSSPYWNSGLGAVTWGDAGSGITGIVSAANSLVGSTIGDKVGMLRDAFPPDGIQGLDSIIPLSGGDYLVASSYFDNGGGENANVGAITWVDGSGPVIGVVSAANSLVGSSTGDRIGQPHDTYPFNGIVELDNGKIAITSAYWDNGATVDAGAVTLVDGGGSFSGVVSPANSLVGSTGFDYVGSHGITLLPNGNFLVRSALWNNLSAGKIEAGAITWGDANSGITGVVSAANSLVGGSDLDRVGLDPIIVLSSSDYIVYSPLWDNGANVDAGAVTWGDGASGTAGLISDSNSVRGITSDQGSSMSFQIAEGNQRLVVGRDLDQIVTIVELLPRLMVHKQGTGSGTVTSNPAGIDCGEDCTELFDPDTLVTLEATPAPGSTFDGWSGACTGIVVCVVTMDQAQTVTASFTAETHLLSVSLSGTGAGTVTSDPVGIDCGSDCTELYIYGTVVTLTATPAPGSIFDGWSGACSGTDDCIVTMEAARAVTAAFSASSEAYTLTVLLAGSGSGTVTSNPAGIDCGSDCSESYSVNTLVTLTATPEAGSIFSGWSGSCSGTDDCVVTMNAAKNVAATFTISDETHSLTILLAGTGSGTVTSNPAGIDCGSDCSESYAAGTNVTLTATPGAGSTFSGWSGACSGTGLCIVTMDTARDVAATFTKASVVQHFIPLIQR